MSFASCPAANDPPPLTILNANSPQVPVLCCDHASNRLPAALRTWDLSAQDRQRHIAWDPGAAALTEALSAALDLVAVFSGYSRLMVDPNRYPDDPSAFPATSDGTVVPGNATLSAAEKAARWESMAEPYHEALAAILADRDTTGHLAPLIAIHTFNPTLAGEVRRTEIGIIHPVPPPPGWPLGAEVLRWLQTMPGELVIGDNDPYPMDGPKGLTLYRHGVDQGRPCVGIEVRNDLVATPEGLTAMTQVLGRCFGSILGVAHDL